MSQLCLSMRLRLRSLVIEAIQDQHAARKKLLESFFRAIKIDVHFESSVGQAQIVWLIRGSEFISEDTLKVCVTIQGFADRSELKALKKFRVRSLTRYSR